MGPEGLHVNCVSPKDLNRILQVEGTEWWILQLVKSHWLGGMVSLLEYCFVSFNKYQKLTAA